MSSKHPMPATIVPHATTTPPCHRPLPKWREHHCHYTVVSIFKRSTPPSTFTAQSCIHWSHHLPLPSFLSSCFLSAHTCHFRRLRNSSSIKLLPLSIPTIWKRVKLLQLSVSVRAFPWSSTTEGWCQHHKEEGWEEPHEGANPTSPTMARFLEMFKFCPLDSSGIVRLLCVPVLDGFSFSCVHSSPDPAQATLISSSSLLSPLEVFL
jgi:hypothetical protein